MEQNTHRMWWTIGVIVLGALLIGGGSVLAKENILPKISQAFVKMIDGKDTINPYEDKWVEKGNWGTNGKFVADKDGNAVIYAIDASKPIVFHNMQTENAKLPKATLTTLTFQDKVQGDTNSSMARAFTPGSWYPNIKTINNLDTNVDTSKVTNMYWMFSSSKLTSVGDLGKWNTSNVTDMSWMFSGTQLTTVGDLSNWNTSNVIDMSGMFRYSSNLTSVGDLSEWNTSNVTNMSYMFDDDSKLTSVGDLSNWNTSNVTDMRWMFSGSQLTLPAWYRYGVINK